MVNKTTASHVASGLTTASIALGVLAGVASFFTAGASLGAYAAYLGGTAAVTSAVAVAGGVSAVAGVAASAAGIAASRNKGQLSASIGFGLLSVATFGISNKATTAVKALGRVAGVVGAAGTIYGVEQEIQGIASGDIKLGKGHAWERLDLFNAAAGGLAGGVHLGREGVALGVQAKSSFSTGTFSEVIKTGVSSATGETVSWVNKKSPSSFAEISERPSSSLAPKEQGVSTKSQSSAPLSRDTMAKSGEVTKGLSYALNETQQKTFKEFAQMNAESKITFYERLKNQQINSNNASDKILINAMETWTTRYGYGY
uniref:Uncharacterized protein n=1 Tax=viral metagenome TaxID=1070528 RepID=A0A6C0IDF1_9ZZZZ